MAVWLKRPWDDGTTHIVMKSGPVVLKGLSVLPAVGVFSWFLVAHAQQNVPQPQAAQAMPPPEAKYTLPVAAEDAWKVPAKDHGKPLSGMVAAKVREREPDLNEADFEKQRMERINLPATKAAAPWRPDTYEDYLSQRLRRYRHRLTRLWVSERLDPEAISSGFARAGVVPGCADDTWAYGREYTVRFSINAGGKASDVSTDGPMALTRCAQERLAKSTFERKSKNKKRASGTHSVVVSFVVVRP